VRNNESTHSNRSNEIALLLCCSRTRLDTKTKKSIHSIVQKEIDWDYIVKTAITHRVFPLLYRSLKITCPQAVPTHHLDRLQLNYLINAGDNLARTTRLLELILLFEDHHIITIPFKGPVLAESAYGDLALRQFVDLDILVYRDQVFDAYQLLLSQGYRTDVSFSAKQIKKYSKTEYSLTATDEDSGMTVELHWEITGRYTGYSFGLDHFGNRLVKTTILGKPIRQFPAEDLLVYLCIHGAKDGWDILDRVCCVAELISAYTDMDWKRVEQLSGKIHCRRMLHLGLFLTHHLLEVELPKRVLKKIESDPVIKKLSISIISTLFLQPDRLNGSLTNSNFSMFHLAIKDRFQDQLRYLLYLLFLPSREDWRYFVLPTHLSFLHYPLRPVRLALEAGTGVMARKGAGETKR
jgi:hypothetical protein